MVRTRKTTKQLLAGVGSLLLGSSLLLSGCGNSTTSAAPSNSTKSSGKIKMVAAENFYGEVAQAVGGDHVEVTSILTNPDTDPHGYEPTAQSSKLVQNAQMVVYNGAGYDAWMENLINAGSSANSKSVIKVADDLMGKKAGDNEHVWYDPTAMPKLANKIADDLAKMDPSHAADFHKRAQTYITSLDPLKEKVQKLKQAATTKIAVSEPVFGYMAAALNLEVGDAEFAKAIDESTDPSPSSLAQLQGDIKNKKIKLFIYNIQNSSPTVDNMIKLAKSNGIPLVKVTETEPKGKGYLKWMNDQLDDVSKALDNK
jgi:zinc/manganese transport system substrate-binding protein